MPTTAAKHKKKSGSRSKKATSSSKKATRTARNDKQSETQVRQKRQAGAIVLFFAAILLAAILIIRGVNVWLDIHNIFFGIFSFSAYILPVIMIYIAIVTAFEKPVQSITAKLSEMFGLVIVIDSIFHIFTVSGKANENFFTIYNGGINFSTGGMAGGILGFPFYYLFGKTGAAITLVLLAVVLVMLLCEITLVKVINAVKPKKRKDEDYQEDAQKMPEEPRMVRFPHKKPRYNIDVDIDDIHKKKDDEPTLIEDSQEPKHSPELEELVSKAAAVNTQNTAAATLAPFKEAAETKAYEQSNIRPSSDGADAQKKSYSFPPITLLKPAMQKANEDVSQELKNNADRLVDTLKSFGVETRVVGICRGPAVTRYELQPSAGVKISRITALSDDIALNLAAAGVRIEAPIPNKSAVGIEVPNRTISVVNLREVVDSDEFRGAKSKLTMAMGKDIAGKTVVSDIAKTPHMLIAGATGSGKSVCINSIIMSVLYKASPDEVKFLMVDPKVVELGIYNGIPHLLVPVVTDPGKAAGALNWAVQEMLGRYKKFAENNVRDIKGYNKLAQSTPEMEKMPQIIIIIDELSDLMMAAPKDVENAICRLAQMARAAGMHLVIATQRPSVDVITGVIKANIPSRIAFAVSSQIDSRTILDMGGAEKLLGRGDMLFLPMGEAKPVRIQGCFVSDAEVEAVTQYVKDNYEATYDNDIIEEIDRQAIKKNDSSGDDAEDDCDSMLQPAIECVVEAGSASTSFLQRRLKLGYARAARIVDQMEQRGIVGPSEGSKPRKVLITRQQLAEMQLGQENQSNEN